MTNDVIIDLDIGLTIESTIDLAVDLAIDLAMSIWPSKRRPHVRFRVAWRGDSGAPDPVSRILLWMLHKIQRCQGLSWV
ncbi:MAG: hypothetical protein KDK91_18050 [Gammaproteobacteria bacterium]|nr:hypothetical protein [Gammaproteobacteria bacterium]